MHRDVVQRMMSTLLRAITRRYPCLSGQGTLVQHAPFSFIRVHPAVELVRLQSGRIVLIDRNDFLGKCAYFFGDIDPKITIVLNALLESGDTLVDIGANVGVVSLNCQEIVGASGRIIAIEPQASCCRLFRKAIRYNRIRNIEIHSLALSDADYSASLEVCDARNSGTASLRQIHIADEQTTVAVRNASEFLRAQDIGNSYVIKIDVEGHEGRVIQGLREYLDICPSKGILFESNDHRYNGQDFYDSQAYHVLTDLEYDIYQIPKTFWRLRLQRISASTCMRQPSATDFLAIPRCLPRNSRLDALLNQR